MADILRKLFPYSFGAEDMKGLVIKVLVYALLGGVLRLLLGMIPVAGLWLSLVVYIYCNVGWVVTALVYIGVFK